MNVPSRIPQLWQLRGGAVELGTRTLVMGVVNVTPDSFSDGGIFVRTEDAVAHALAMFEEGESEPGWSLYFSVYASRRAPGNFGAPCGSAQPSSA